MATHSPMVSGGEGLLSLHFPPAVIVICGAITTQLEEEGALQRDKSVSRLMRDILAVSASAHTLTHGGKDPSLEWKLNHMLCQSARDRRWRELAWVTGHCFAGFRRETPVKQRAEKMK